MGEELIMDDTLIMYHKLNETNPRLLKKVVEELRTGERWLVLSWQNSAGDWRLTTPKANMGCEVMRMTLAQLSEKLRTPSKCHNLEYAKYVFDLLTYANR
jgi:hypothetical protein